MPRCFYLTPFNDGSNEPARKCVRVDGAWQKRGHSSFNGFVSAVVDDRCVDIEVFSKFCYGCKMWERKKEHHSMTNGKHITFVQSIMKSHQERWRVQVL